MNKKGNILFFKFSLVIGGGELFNLLLSKELARRGYRVTFFSNFKPLIRKLRNIGIKVKKIYWGNELGAIRYIPQFFLILPFNVLRFFFILIFNKKTKENNVVIFQNLNEKVFATSLAKFLGYKVFWVEHISVGSWLTNNILKNNYIKSSLRADKIVVVSFSIKKDLIEKLGISENKIEVIYNGVDLERFIILDPRAVENEKKKYGFFRGSQIIGYTGRIHKEKGIEVLINSFSELCRRFDHIYLLLVGDGPERKNLEILVSDLGLEKKVLFLGYKEDVNLFLNMIDIFVLPSKIRESFGISIIEAMAVEKPVVASNIGGIPEIINDSNDGFLFLPGDTKDLTDKLSRLLSNEGLRKSIGKAAHIKVKENFSLDVMSNKFEELFQR